MKLKDASPIELKRRSFYPVLQVVMGNIPVSFKWEEAVVEGGLKTVVIGALQYQSCHRQGSISMLPQQWSQKKLAAPS